MNESEAMEAVHGASASSELLSQFKELVSRDVIDFEAALTVSRQLAEMHFHASKRMVELYNPRSATGFAEILDFFSSLFIDKREPPVVLGISVATYYRWKSKQSQQHALTRASVKETIQRYLSSYQFVEPGGQRPPASF